MFFKRLVLFIAVLKGMHTTFSDFRTMKETSHKFFLLFLFKKFVCFFSFYIPTKVSPSSPPHNSSPPIYAPSIYFSASVFIILDFCFIYS